MEQAAKAGNRDHAPAILAAISAAAGKTAHAMAGKPPEGTPFGA